MRLRKTVILGMLCISLLGVTACGKDKDAAAGTTESGETNATQEIVQEETMTEEITTEAAPTQSSTEVVSTQAPTQKPTQAPVTPKPTEAPTQAPTQKPTQAPVTPKPTEAPTQAPTPNPKELLKLGTNYTFRDDSPGSDGTYCITELGYYYDPYDDFWFRAGSIDGEGTYTLTDEEIILTISYPSGTTVVLTMTADGNIVVKSVSGEWKYKVGTVFSLEKNKIRLFYKAFMLLNDEVSLSAFYIIGLVLAIKNMVILKYV